MRLGDKGMSVVVAIALFALAVNAVLIQTIWVDAPDAKNVVRVGVLMLLGCAMFMRRTVIPVWLALTIAASASLMVLRGNPDQLSLIFVLVLVPALWSLPEGVVDRIAASAALLTLGLIFVLLAAGITHNSVIDLRQRTTYGVDSVPFFMNAVFGAGALTIVFVQKYRYRVRHIVTAAVVLVGYYFFTQTDGRGGFYALASFAALVYVMPYLVKIPLVSQLLIWMPAICLALSLWIAGRSDDHDLNVLLSYRPRFYAAFLDQVSDWDFLTSTSVKQNPFVENVDNSYLHLLVGGGLPLFLIFCLFFLSAASSMIRNRRYLELSFVTSVLVYSVSESILLRIENIFIVFAWWLILRHAEVGQNPSAPEASTPRAGANDAPGARQMPELGTRSASAVVWTGGVTCAP